MSRCFPYPPPGYALSRASNEALIESIKLQKEKEKEMDVKLQKEREKAKAERKREKKREKDEKKKLEEKAKLNTFGHDAYGDKSWGDSKDGYLQKERRDDPEQLERSSITEEHSVPQNPSYSSDSTENSNKRKRHSAVSNGTRVQGNILRIRLPPQKNIQCSKTDCEKQLCSTSGRIELLDTIAARAEPEKTCSTSGATANVAQSLPPHQPVNEVRQSCPSQILTSSKEEKHSGSDHGSKRYKKMRKIAKKYSDLIENWVPPSRPVQCLDDDDQEWLFGRKNQQMQMHSDKKDLVVPQMSCSSSTTLWPSARYLPGADIYALPYTIPF